MCAALLPDEATIERVPCSCPGHAPDLLARLHGTGSRRILLLGHVDTVVAHAEHRPLHARRASKLVGSGSVDMKGGVVLALGAMRALRPRARRTTREVALLLVCDEEWRTGAARATSSASPAGTRACASRPASSRPTATRASSCGARRRARSRSTAHGRSAHSGSAPDRGRNALLALGVRRPGGRRAPRPRRPGAPDRRADRAALGRRVQRRARPRRALLRPARRRARRDRGGARRDPGRASSGVRLEAELIRRWPGHALRGRRRRRCSRAPARRSGARSCPRARGGASDASHFAARDPGHGRRARPARRRGAQPGRVRARGLAASRAPRSRWR